MLPTPKQKQQQPSTLFRPWDTPESLSPTSTQHISPTSSSSTLNSSPVESSLNSSPPQQLASLNSSPETDASPAETVISSSPLINRAQIKTDIKKECLLESAGSQENQVPATPFFSLINTMQSPSFYSPFLPPYYFNPKSEFPKLNQQVSPLASRKRKFEEDLGASPNLQPKRSRLSYDISPLYSSPGGQRVAGTSPGSGERLGGGPCGVCKEATRPGQHYGAAVCEGCKVNKIYLNLIINMLKT